MFLQKSMVVFLEVLPESVQKILEDFLKECMKEFPKKNPGGLFERNLVNTLEIPKRNS